MDDTILPRDGDIGISLNGAMVPISLASSVPAFGQHGVDLGGVFAETVPPFQADAVPSAHINIPLPDDAPPTLSVQLAIDREPPFLDETRVRVAPVCVSPYEWEAPAATRTVILDTVLDADATPEEKALSGYVPNPGLMLSSKTMERIIAEVSPVTAASINTGQTYRIATLGDTDFTLIGAASNTVGVEFVATGAGVGTGTATPVPKWNDVDGVGVRWNYAGRFNNTTAPSALFVGSWYAIDFVGTTDWVAVGAASNTYGLIFQATAQGSGTGIAYACEPHPELRQVGTIPGSYKYKYPIAEHPTTAALGHEFEGTAFLPGEPGEFVGGVLAVVGYRYGYEFVQGTFWTIAVKIGRATATWDKDAQTLALACDTTGAALFYSTDGSAPTTAYMGPISIADTTTVKWKATKSGMVDSDTWSTYIEYQDAMPPDDFTTVVFSSLPVIANTPIWETVRFQPNRPTYYCSATGTGDGMTPATPGSFASIIGDTFTNTKGKAVGARWIDIAKSGSYGFTLAKGGNYLVGTATGATIKYQLPGGAWTDYTSAVTPTLPGIVKLKLYTPFAGGFDFTREFLQPWYLGTGASIQADWDFDTKTLTLAYSHPDSSILVQYSLDGGTTWLDYSAPITISATCTPRVMARHILTGRRYDFATESDQQTLTTIDPGVTADYTETKNLTFVTSTGAVTSWAHVQPQDVVWLSAGTYASLWNDKGVYVRGGYNADFTQRDVLANQSVIGYPVLSGTTDVLDGCIIPMTSNAFATTFYACHGNTWTAGSAELSLACTRLIGCKFDWTCANHPPQQNALTLNQLYYPPNRFPLVRYGPRISARSIYGCDINIDLTCVNGPDGSNYGSAYSAYRHGWNSGAWVTVQGTDKIVDSSIRVNIMAGTGGDGVAWTEGPDEWGQTTAYVGDGGHSLAQAYVSSSACIRSTVSVTTQTATAGDGASIEYDPGYGTTWAFGWNGISGATSELSISGSAATSSDNTVSLSAAAGGGGTGCEDVPGPPGGPGPVPFGISGAKAAISGYGAIRTDGVQRVECGENPDPGDYDPYLYPFPRGVFDAFIAGLPPVGGFVLTAQGHYIALDIDANSGNASWTFTQIIGYGANAIDAPAWRWDAAPTIAVGGGIYGNGTPAHPDAYADHPYYGAGSAWYSGEPDGNGAPLAGYESAGSGGTVLGRYWE